MLEISVSEHPLLSSRMPRIDAPNTTLRIFATLRGAGVRVLMLVNTVLSIALSRVNRTLRIGSRGMMFIMVLGVGVVYMVCIQRAYIQGVYIYRPSIEGF